MSVVVRCGVARGFVVEPGDTVAAQGRFVHTADADWLDLAQVDGLVGHTRSWKSNRSVRLSGADVTAIPTAGRGDRSLMPGQISVVGVWRDDVINVEAQSGVRWPSSKPNSFALPAPRGGWDVTTVSTDVEGLEELRASGQVVRDGWLREAGGAQVLRVAAADVDAVKRVLAAQLRRRLYVVRSRYSLAQLRGVDEMFAAHHRDWGFESWSHQGLNAECQPFTEAALTRISADLGVWADTLPDGLLTLRPAMIPAH